MGNIVVRDPATGMPYTVRIAGDTPTEAEQNNINNFLSRRAAPAPVAARAVAAPPDEGGGIGALASGFGRGLGVSLAEMPGGIAAFGETLFGYNPGETAIGRHFLEQSRRGSERVIGWTGEGDGSLTGKTGEVLGSLASFFLPAGAFAKGATLLGAGTRGASWAAGAGAALAGSGLGAQEQLARIEQRLAQGEVVPEEDIRKAVRIGGAIGLSEGIPAEIIFSQAFRILRKVPRKARDEAIRTIAGKLKSAAVSALAEGGQEVFASVAQDLTEKGIYNPELEVGQSAAQDFAAGAGAGGGLTLLLDAVRGRQLAKFDRKKKQIDEDLAARTLEAAEQAEFGRSAVAQIQDEERFQAEQAAIKEEEPQRRAEMARQQAEMARQNAERERGFAERAAARAEQERAAALAAHQESVRQRQVESEARISRANEAQRVRDAEEAARQETGRIAMLAEQQERDRLGRLASEQRVASEAADKEARIELAQKTIKQRDAEEALRKVLVEERQKQTAKVQEVMQEDSGVARASEDLRTSERLKQEKAALSPPVVKPEEARELPLSIPKVHANLLRQHLPRYAEGMQDVGDKVNLFIGDPERIMNDIQNVMNAPGMNARDIGYLSALRGNVRKRAEGRYSAQATEQKSGWQPKSQDEYRAGTFNEDFIQKRDAAVNAVRKELSGFMPEDRVDLVAENVLRPDLLMSEQRTLVEGMETPGDDPGKRLISIATDIYDPKISEEEFTQRLRGVMGHELIHALRSLGLFTDREWDALVRAAEETKYVTVINGRKVERDYTFMEREIARNDMSAEDVKIRDMDTLQEEAVADMFRAHLEGRINPKPETRRLFGRVIRFLKSLVRGMRATGFDTRDKIFSAIRAGEIGRRDPADSRYDTSFSSEPIDLNQRREEIAEQKRLGEFHAKLRGDISELMKLYRRLVEDFETTTDVYKNLEVGSRIRLSSGNIVKITGHTVNKVGNEANFIRYYRRIGINSMPLMKAGVSGMEGAMYAPMVNYEAAEGERGQLYADALQKKGFQKMGIRRDDARYSSYISGTYDTPNLHFYSPLARELWNAKQQSASPRDWKAIIAALPGIKQAEIKWTGVNEWLDSLADNNVRSVSRDDVARHVMDHTPKLVEHEKYFREISDLRELDEPEPDDPLLRNYDGRPKFQQWTEDAGTNHAGTNYREILITDPVLEYRGPNVADKVSPFVQSSHFEEENIIVHARVTDRNEGDGKTLFIEEIQSDLGTALRNRESVAPEVLEARRVGEELQAAIQDARDNRNRLIDIITNEFGRRHNVYPDATYNRFAERIADVIYSPDYARQIIQLREDAPVTSGNWQAAFYQMLFDDPEMMSVAKEADRNEMALDLAFERQRQHWEGLPENIRAAATHYRKTENIPDMPWAGTAYYDLAVKRLLREAAIGRYDKMAWTPGYMQAERWQQSFGARVNRVEWFGFENGSRHVMIHLNARDGDLTSAMIRVDQSGISDGDDGLNNRTKGHHISELVGNELGKRIMGEDRGDVRPDELTFGKSGFTHVYDNVIRKAVEKITKQHGVVPELDRTVLADSQSDRDAASELLGRHLRNRTIVEFARERSLIPEPELLAIFDKSRKQAEEELRDKRKRYEKLIAMQARNPRGLLAREKEELRIISESLQRWNEDKLTNVLAGRDVYHVLRYMPASKILGKEAVGRPVWSVTITPDLRKALTNDWMPLYSAVPAGRDLNAVIDRQDERLNYTHAYNILTKGLKLVPLADAEKAADRAKWFITQFQDRMVPIGEIIDHLRGEGLTITEAMDVYRKEMLYHGLVGSETTKAENNLYLPAIEAVEQVKVPMNKWEDLKKVSAFARLAEDAYGSHKLGAVEAYLYARHAKERNAYIASIDPGTTDGSGMTDAESDAILKWHAGLAPDLKAQIAGAVARFDAIIGHTNSTRVDGGLTRDFSDPSYEGVRFNHYAPLRGKLLEENLDSFLDEIVPGTGLARSRPLFGATGREDRRMLGRSGQYARDLFANAMAQNTQAIQRAERNKVFLSLLELIENSGGALDGSIDIVRGPDGQPSIPMTRKLVDGRVQMAPDLKYRDERERYVIGKRDGREIVLDVADPRVAQAMNGTLSPKGVNSLVRGMARINRWLANINTSWNLEFLLSNLPRDVFLALYNTGQYDEPGLRREVRRNIWPALRGIFNAIFGDGKHEFAQVYREFVESGGQNTLNTMEDLGGHIRKMESRLRHIHDEDAAGRIGATKDALVGKGAWLLHTLEGLNTVAENASRVALFKALRDRGVTKDRSAASARDITTNFAKGGELKVALNSFYLFYNASLQGSMAIFNATARNPKKMVPLLGKVVLFGALMDQINALLSDEDDNGRLVYDEIQDYSLEHNLIIPDLFGVSERSNFRIPIPYGLNMFFNTGRAMSRMMRGTYETKDFINTIYGTALETFNPFSDSYNPITGEGSFTAMIAPTIVDPFIRLANNEDYADRPIYKEQTQFGVQTPNSHLHWASTNPALVHVTKFLNDITGGSSVVPGAIDWSPDKMEFWIEFATGAAGQTLVRFAGLPFLTAEALGEGIQDDMLNNIPIVRKYTIAVSEREDVGFFVDKRDRVMMAKKEFDDAREVGDAERAKAARQKYAYELSIEPKVRKLNNARNNLRRKRAKIEANTRIPQAQKQAMLDRIDKQIEEIIRQGNKLMKDVR